MGSRKGKRRNTEKRKEKSRDAARCRRTKEGEVFASLANQLPLESSLTLQQDKASIMRLAISHLKLRQLLGKEITMTDYSNSLQRKLDTQYAKALDGFVLVLGKEGDLIYLSESVSKYLGLTQLELIGHSIYDFAHPCDHDEIREILSEKPAHNTEDIGDRRSFLMRMKCTLTNKGRNINLKSATYKTLSCSGRYVSATSANHQFPGLLDDKSLSCLLLIGEPIPHPSNIEVPLDGRTFVSRHSMDMKFTYCDERITSLLGYRCDDLIGQSAFDFYHALDTETIKEAYKNLYSKTQAVIGRYRYLAQGGGYCWVQTEVTMVTNQRTDKPQCVVCVNYVLSGVEEKSLIMSNVQMLTAAAAAAAVSEPEPDSQPLTSLPSGMVFSTGSIFAPRPLDADKDMLRITDGDGKENVLLDLDQLAPSAGDVMMPLIINDVNDCELKNDYAEKASSREVFATETILSDCLSQPVNTSTTDMSILDLSYLRNPPTRPMGGVPAPGDISVMSSGVNSAAQKPNKTLADSLLEDEDIDFDMRAPFIPMDGDEDKIFEINWVPLLDEQMEYNEMLGTTESVFTPEPKETTNHTVPLSVLRLQAANKQIDASVGDIARHAGPPKMKRPMETNRLETGPPVEKLPKVCVEPVTTATQSPGPRETPHDTQEKYINSAQVSNTQMNFPDMTSFFKDKEDSDSGSVLRNLLTRGEDVNYGYKIRTEPRGDPASTLRALLTADLSTDYDDSSSDDDVIMLSSSPESLPEKSVPVLPRQVAPETSELPRRVVQSPKVVVIRINNSMLVAPLAGKPTVLSHSGRQ